MKPNPIEQFAEWWRDEQVPVVVATASPDGRPTARAVVLEAFDERGFCFWSSAESPKGRQLAANPHAALVFLWDGRQTRIEGRVERVADDENERHWQERDGKRQLSAFRQSQPVEDREALERLLDAAPDDPPRPGYWVGYRVVPERFEFWIVDPDFVHDRFEYARADGSWRLRRLQP